MALGRKEQYKCLEEDSKDASVQGLCEAHAVNKTAGRCIGRVVGVERKNTCALQRMPSGEFRKPLDPVFQVDEWILILLGVVVGLVQVVCFCPPFGMNSRGCRNLENFAF